MTLITTILSTKSCNPIPDCNKSSQLTDDGHTEDQPLFDFAPFPSTTDPFTVFSDFITTQSPTNTQTGHVSSLRKWRLLRNTVKFIGYVTHPRVEKIEKPQNLNQDFKEFQDCLINIQNFKKRTENGQLNRSGYYSRPNTF